MLHQPLDFGHDPMQVPVKWSTVRQYIHTFIHCTGVDIVELSDELSDFFKKN